LWLSDPPTGVQVEPPAYRATYTSALAVGVLRFSIHAL
jgi:hypothetical protein